MVNNNCLDNNWCCFLDVTKLRSRNSGFCWDFCQVRICFILLQSSFLSWDIMQLVLMKNTDSNIDRKSCLTASWSPPYSALWFWQQLQSLVASRRSRSMDSTLDARFYPRNFRRLFKIYPQVVASLANYYFFFLLFLLGDSLFHVKAVVCVRLWLITIIEQPCMR